MRRASKSCNGAIRRKACGSFDRTRITGTSKGWCSSWKAAMKTRQPCDKVPEMRASSPRSSCATGNVYCAVPKLPEANGQGRTPEETMKDLVAAIQLVLDEPERAADITDRQRRRRRALRSNFVRLVRCGPVPARPHQAINAK